MSDNAATPTHKRVKGKSSGRSILKETVIIVISAIALSWILKTFLIQAFYIPSSSMEDTLAVGDRVVVNQLAPGPFDVHRGDIVVFEDPGGWLNGTASYVDPNSFGERARGVLKHIGLAPQDSENHLIKRVIGVEGDTVACCDAEGRLTVNGVSITEPYLKPGEEPSVTEFSAIVPEGHLWVMGDNRGHSSDSRFHTGEPGGGAIPIDNVVGVAFAIVWPFGNFGLLTNPGETFDKVPEPTSSSTSSPPATTGRTESPDG